MVDKASSVANTSGDVYGATVYRQGFYDGMKLMREADRG